MSKVTLFAMADAVGLEAEAWAGRQARPEHSRALAAAHLTLALMALDEDASRALVRSLTTSSEARLLIGMLMPAPPEVRTEGMAA